jgi:trehalose synthase
MRVIVDLVVNHTSDQHPWFLDARSSRDSRHRDWYVWVDEPPEDLKLEAVFPDKAPKPWEYDRHTKQYFLHRFYRHQPDLNVTNPEVRDEIEKVMGFWLQLGVSGFRVDAVPFLLETVGESASALPQPHDYLRDLRALVGRRSGDGILLGEVNLPREQQLEYFGGDGGDELTMQFDFIGMQRLYLSLARRDAGALVEALTTRPPVPADAQWATFVRNHDELTLDKLTDEEKEEVFAAFGPEPRMQIYGRGLVRRLPTMLGGDPRRLRMVYSLMFSLPGTPVLFYGEEIGMGEDLDAEGRNAVRTPMQWTPARNGGFSTADAEHLPGPVVSGGYGPEHVNVQDQRADPDSLLNFMRLLIARYRSCPELGWGSLEVLEQPHASVLAHRCTWEDGSLVAVHNLAEEAVTVPLKLSDVGPGCHLLDLLQNGTTPVPDDGAVEIQLEAYGHRWLRISSPDDRRLR